MIRRFKDLLAPLSEQEFLDSFSRKSRLVVKTAQRERTASLLPWATINHLLSAGIVSTSKVRAVVLSRTIPEHMYRRGRKSRLRPDALHQLAAQGVNISINRIGKYVPAIASLADSMERRIGHRVRVNCYITFGKASAFKPHYDTHDVLAVQIHGAKRWRGYGIPIPYPLPPDDGKVERHSNPVWDELIEAGDALYVPRGEAHDAVGEVTPSVHLTFGIHAPTGIDVLSWVAERARTDPAFRMDVSRVGGEDALHRYELELKQNLKNLIDQLSFDTFLDEADQKRRPRVRLSVGFDGALNADTWLTPTPRRRIALAPESKGDAAVTVGGTNLPLSADARRAFQVVFDEDGLSFKALAEKLATSVQDKTLREAVGQLVAKGLCATEP
jgi:ribosomal protein L16 Arg81 hydroxylase